MLASDLRGWQREALGLWQAAGQRGIVGAVTGGGKTIFALACIRASRPATTLVVVPTVALQDQWWEEAAAFFDVPLDDINVISGRAKVVQGTINIAVLNTAARLVANWDEESMMLVVDECHKAASPKFSSILSLPARYRLGLSATPERPYDEGLRTLLIPSLGEIIFQYSYSDALRDGVIVPFDLNNVVFELEEDTRLAYQKLTRSIAKAITQYGADSSEAIRLYLRRAQVLNSSPARVELALRLAAKNRGRRILIFHENVEACEVIDEVLRTAGFQSGLYHSGLNGRLRAQVLSSFRKGEVEVLVTCRALDEGFNVPETEIGIIAASTATRRQRIQRLGRVLRPASGKDRAAVYTLLATGPEMARLKSEEEELEGVANVTWSRA